LLTIKFNPDFQDKFFPILHANVPQVKAEEGCAAYEPTVQEAVKDYVRGKTMFGF
jgi:quinol monooxygenase YgiN